MKASHHVSISHQKRHVGGAEMMMPTSYGYNDMQGYLTWAWENYGGMHSN